MPRTPRSYDLSELTWVDVQRHLEHDQRLIVPIGACDQYGPHLPVGAATSVVDALSADLSREFGVLRSPVLSFGVNVPADRIFPGSAGVREKTLHALLNELLGAWEAGGFNEFILITTQLYDPHVEAIATAQAKQARVRVIEVLAVDLSHLLEGTRGPQHAGEVLTSLAFHLYPQLIGEHRTADFPPDQDPPGLPARGPIRIPEDSPGTIGKPSLASPEKGARLYEHILQKIRTRIFLAPPDDTES